MKKVAYTIAMVLLIYSCAEGVKDGAANREDGNDHMVQARRNTEHNRVIYDALQTGDVSKLDSFLAPDMVDHEASMGKDIVGRDSVKAFISKVHTYFDNYRAEVISEGTSLDNNYHFAMFRMRGKAKENPWGIPVGQEFDDMGVDVVKIRDGKATEHWSFTSQKDINEMMAAMGGMQPTVKDNGR